jgi:hypothetical protein
VLLRGSYELVSRSDQNVIVVVFGREQTQQCRAFKYFADHIYDKVLHLVTDNISWWYNNEYMHRSRDAIRNKLEGNEYFSIFAFIDCNCLDTSRLLRDENLGYTKVRISIEWNNAVTIYMAIYVTITS